MLASVSFPSSNSVYVEKNRGACSLKDTVFRELEVRSIVVIIFGGEVRYFTLGWSSHDPQGLRLKPSSPSSPSPFTLQLQKSEPDSRNVCPCAALSISQ